MDVDGGVPQPQPGLSEGGSLEEVYRRQAADPATYGEHWSGPPQMVERIATLAGTRRDHLVLDVGCGVGGPARRLHRVVGCPVVGLDAAAEVLLPALRSGDGVRYVAATATALPFDAGSFDQVWSLGVVAHVPEVSGFVAEAARVLRPGGMLAVTEVFWGGAREPRFLASAPAPWRPTTLEEFSAAMVSAGMTGRSLPWPGRGHWSPREVGDPALRADLLAGTLVPGFVLAQRP